MPDGSLNGVTQDLINIVAQNALTKGDYVVVAEGTHRGETGHIFWLGENIYSTAYRYGSDLHHAFADVRKRYGWRAGIRRDDGAKFFVNCEKIFDRNNVVHQRLVDNSPEFKALVERVSNGHLPA